MRATSYTSSRISAGYARSRIICWVRRG